MPRPQLSEAQTADDLGASRAGKPANSPVGAISRRRGFSKEPAPFFIFARPTQDAQRLYIRKFQYSMLRSSISKSFP